MNTQSSLTLPSRVLVATANRGKLAEINAVLRDLGAAFLSLADLGASIPPAIEDCDTFAANARKKALHYAHHTGMWTLADDSGLVVDALGGAPGVRSARFAGSHATDDQNNRKLIEMLRDVPDALRTARFICAICLAQPGDPLVETTGTLEGRLLREPSGYNGFGYDPLFFIPSLDRTAAQLSREEKNAISHRGQALKKLKQRLG